MIIDTHTHFYDPTRPQGVPWPPSDNKLLYRAVLPAHYKELAVPQGVAGTVVVEASAWLEDNQWIFDLAAEDPFLVGLVGHIDPNRAAFRADLQRFAANPRLRGIRCHGGYFENIEADSFLADIQQLADMDLALDVLVREEHIPAVVQLAQRIPTLRIVVNHTAHMPVDGNPVTTQWHENYQKLAAQPQIHMKVSAVMEQYVTQPAPADLESYRPALDAMWNAFGQDRLLYGSNWPVCERAGSFIDSINIVKAYFAEKGERAYDRYFWKNAQTVYQFSIPK